MTDGGDHVAELAARVEARRRAGAYPDRADEALEREVERRLATAARQTTELRAAVDRLRLAGPYRLRSRQADRGAKALLSAAVERAVGHALRDLTRQLDEHEAALLDVLDLLVDRAEPPRPEAGPPVQAP